MLIQKKGRLLSSYTSLKIGGPVFYWAEAGDVSNVLEVISVAEARNKSLVMIGNGSNILASDEGFDGVVLSLSKEFSYIKEGDGAIKVGAALSVSELVRECSRRGLAGCEFLSGIPGSIGGAIFMNAGVRSIEDAERQREIKDIIIDVDLVDLKDKRKESLKRDDIDFSYRSSGLKGKCILGATLKLQKDNKESIRNKVDSFMKKRVWIQKLGFPSAGSVFKNPDNERPAGFLIDECGLKGRRSGRAEISREHANFIVNTGGAVSKDVLELVLLARKSVKDKFGIKLELELSLI